MHKVQINSTKRTQVINYFNYFKQFKQRVHWSSSGCLQTTQRNKEKEINTNDLTPPPQKKGGGPPLRPSVTQAWRHKPDLISFHLSYTYFCSHMRILLTMSRRAVELCAMIGELKMKISCAIRPIKFNSPVIGLNFNIKLYSGSFPTHILSVSNLQRHWWSIQMMRSRMSVLVCFENLYGDVFSPFPVAQVMLTVYGQGSKAVRCFLDRRVSDFRLLSV